MQREKLFLIDGNSLCYRAYYAIRDLSTSGGKPTNAIYGFINMLRKILKDEHPDYLAIAFDVKGPTFRHKMFDEYKIKRRPMPNDLIEQMPTIKEVIQAYNIPIFEKEGYEADDVLATMVTRLKSPHLEIYIVTGDKDTLQLVDETVKVYNSYHKEVYIYDQKRVRERFGVEPEFVPDILALTGDETDNIPGIKGIGEKTAEELLQQFKSLDELINHIDEIRKDNLRQTLKENQPQLKINRKLAILDKNVPIKIELEELRLKEPKNNKLISLFKELEFKNFLKELMQEEKFQVSVDFKKVDNKKELDIIIGRIEQKKEFAFELYTQENARGIDGLTGLSLYYGDGGPFFIRLGKEDSPILLKDLAIIFEDSFCLKACYDLKRAKSILDTENISIKGDAFDVLLAAYLVDPSKSSYELEDISLEYLDSYPHSAFMESAEPAFKMSEAVKTVFNLYQILKKILVEKKLFDLYKNVEMPLVDVLFSMEKKGVHLNLDFLNKLSVQLNNKLDDIKKDIIQTAGRQFNLDSPKQLREILFTELKLPVIKKVKTGPSTDEEVLIKLSGVHRLPKLILEYRELAKLESTYVDNLSHLVNRQTGRIHTTFNQVGTETGRLSSRNPNLQNIPAKTEFARQIRKAISSETKDYLLLSADYSQIELRILAHLSEDNALILAFEKDLDIHTHTAALIFSLPEEKIDERQRGIAKTVNFGIIYGMSPFGLSRELNIDVAEAEKFIKSYFERYPKVKSYIESKIKEARRRGFVATILNRRRFIPEINSSNQKEREFAERIAVNTPIQGSAADIIKLAMVRIHEKIHAANIDAYLILQIHDELLFEFSKIVLEELIRIVSDEMENVVKLSVPLKVSLKVGRDWLEMEPVK